MLDRMHAVVQQAFGGPEVLEVAEVDRPVPLATEVLVRVKAVLDSLGGEIARRSISVLRPGGILITIVDRRDVDLAARTRAAGRRFAGLSVEPDYPGLEALAGLVDSGQLRVHLQTTLPLTEAAKAHQLLESGRTTGKIVLTI